jgi:transcriptional antiterminator RfaH
LGYTNPASENRAATFLKGAGAEVYNPKIIATVRHARTITTKDRPLFPRYLFFRGCPLEVARNLPGIGHIVRRGRDVVVVRNGVVAQLLSMEVNGYIVLPEKPPSDRAHVYRQGQRVRVKDGPFVGKVALFERMTDRDRVSVLLTIIGRSITVDLPFSAVARDD